MKNFILIAVCILSGIFPSSAGAADVQSRMDLINRTLDCMSDRSGQKGVDWNDVCFTQPAGDSEVSRVEIMDKSMDDVAREHEVMANEMLNTSIDVHDNRKPPQTVDEVYEEQQRENEAVKSLDDVVAEHQHQDEVSPVPAARVESHPAQASYRSEDIPAGRASGLFNQEPMTSRLASLRRDADQNQNTSEIGFEFNRFRYVEPVFDLVDKGNLYGFYVNFTARPSKHEAMFEEIIDMYRADFRFNYGLVDYSSAPSGTLDGNRDWTLEGRLLAGKDYVMSEDLRVTPYLGFGYRHLNDNSSKRATSVGHFGYERDSRYLYIPLGVELTFRACHGWMVSPSVEYDWLIQGKQTSHLSDVDPGLPDVRNKQRDGFGVRASLKFMKVADPVTLVLEPYIRYWHIEDSDEATVAGSTFIVTGLEPENKTTEYGVRIGAMF